MKSTVLVTGGTGAIGALVSKRLLSEGHRVAATWLHGEEPKERFLEARGSELVYVRSDVTDPASIACALEKIESRFGAVDALVHRVGAWSGATPVHSIPSRIGTG
jgi:3-oxoacyl-[acyl-carrier protein] reductase